MSIIEEGKELIRRVENNILTHESAFAENIEELIEELEYTKILVEETKALYQDELNIIGLELEKQQEVIDVVNNYINNSYSPKCKGDLMRFNEMKNALASLEKDNEKH